MPKFFVSENQIKENKITIKDKDVNHIKNVLRKKINDEIIICNLEKSEDNICKILDIQENKIICEILKKSKISKEQKTKVTIFQKKKKKDKMELIIQKSVELGAYDITPVEMKRCVVKLNQQDKLKKLDRWQKISEVAAKQCTRNIIPKINEIIAIKDICAIAKNYDILIVPYENEKKYTLKQALKEIKENKEFLNKKDFKIGVLIGPEGGIEEAEIEELKKQGFKVVTLGKRILRTETVALNILSIIMYELEDEEE